MIARVCMIAILATCVSATLLSSNEYESMFSAHMEKYDRVYDASEKAARFGTFIDNIDFILTHNMEAEKGKHTFTLAANQFSDWTNEEYRQKMNNLRRDMSSARPMATSTHTDDNVQDLPASWDWVDHGAVTPVKNQGQCGSCWAFSATAAMEGSNFQNTGKLISLSEQMCVDCVNGGADTCDMGGEMHDCYLQVIKQGGDNLESDYPYQATSGHQCRYNASKAVATEFTGYKNVTQGDENALQVASQKAVISVGIDASSFEFQFYSSGVYNVPSCKNGWYELDHGVTVTGWGSLNGDDYWVVKNSWGNSWGKAGYIWMSRNKNNQCGIATDATFLTMGGGGGSGSGSSGSSSGSSSSGSSSSGSSSSGSSGSGSSSSWSGAGSSSAGSSSAGSGSSSSWSGAGSSSAGSSSAGSGSSSSWSGAGSSSAGSGSSSSWSGAGSSSSGSSSSGSSASGSGSSSWSGSGSGSSAPWYKALTDLWG